MPTTLNNITVELNGTRIFKAATGELNDNGSEVVINVAPTDWLLAEHARANYGHNNRNEYTIKGTRGLQRQRIRGINDDFEVLMRIEHWQLMPPLFRFSTN